MKWKGRWRTIDAADEGASLGVKRTPGEVGDVAIGSTRAGCPSRLAGPSSSPVGKPDRHAGFKSDVGREHQWPLADPCPDLGRATTRPLLPVLRPPRREVHP